MTTPESAPIGLDRRQITLPEFLAILRAQGVPQEHWAYKCVKCGHIQSAASLVRYMAPDVALNSAYHACEGRFNGTVGCDWTLGGLFQLHKLEVLTADDVVVGLTRTVPVFEPATPEEAQTLMQHNLSNRRTCRVCGCDDFNPCPEGCFWVESDLCSVCAEKEAL